MKGPLDPERPLSPRRRKAMQDRYLAMGRRHCEWCEDLPHRREAPCCPVCLQAPKAEKLPHGDQVTRAVSMLGQTFKP
jgi:hypothetical protein